MIKKVILSSLVAISLVGCFGEKDSISKENLPSYCTFASETVNGSQINHCVYPNGDRCYVLEGVEATGNSISCTFTSTQVP